MQRGYKLRPPHTNINSLGPLERNPDHPSPRTRRHLHHLLQQLLYQPNKAAIVQADKILAGYPYLRDEWGPRISAAERALRSTRPIASNPSPSSVPRPRSQPRP
jgi:hypothetical protein